MQIGPPSEVGARAEMAEANAPKTYEGEIDLFGVYSPDLDNVFLVPIAEVPSRVCHLRLGPARNGQVKKLMWATDYVIGSALSEESEDR